MIDAARFADADWCHALSASDRDALARELDERVLEAGQVLIAEGEGDRDLHIVLAGHLRVSRHGHDVGVVPLHGFVGDAALHAGRRRAARVVAVGPAVVARLAHPRWLALRTTHPSLCLCVTEAIAQAIAEQLIHMTDDASLGERRLAASAGAAAGAGVAEVTVHVVEGARTMVASAARGTTVGSLLPSVVDGAPVVSALLAARSVALDTPVLADSDVSPVTAASWEGREVWRRSAGLLFLAAAARVAPECAFQLLHSVGAARVIRCSPAACESAPRIEAEMGRLVAADARFSREPWSVEAARTYFSRRGNASAVSLLATARAPTVVVSGLAGTFVYAMGPLVPTTGLLSGVRLSRHPDGLLLDYRATLGAFIDGASETIVRERAMPRFASRMAAEHERWLTSMRVDSVGHFNTLCVTGKVRDTIRVAEGFHEKHIGKIADDITAGCREATGRGLRIIAIAGPSSSGKSTFIKRLTVQLEVNGVRPINLSLDDYFLDRERCPRDASGELDFEVLGALDLDNMQDHVRRLLRGEGVSVARFDFTTGVSAKAGGPSLELAHNDVLLVEGIHGLNPALFGAAVESAQVFRIFVQPALCLPFDSLTALSPVDVRLLRRIVRDRHARGFRTEETILRWPSVRRGEARHIFPHQRHADATFDSSLAYEVSVLKVFAERYLLEVPPGHAAFSTAFRLRQLLDRFVAIYPDHVPPTSILREFIGGSGFEY